MLKNCRPVSKVCTSTVFSLTIHLILRPSLSSSPCNLQQALHSQQSAQLQVTLQSINSLALRIKSGSTRASLYRAQQACRPQESPSGLVVKTLLQYVKANSPSIHKSALFEKLWPAGTAGEQTVIAETLVQLQSWTITSSFCSTMMKLR